MFEYLKAFRKKSEGEQYIPVVDTGRLNLFGKLNLKSKKNNYVKIDKKISLGQKSVKSAQFGLFYAIRCDKITTPNDTK